MQSVNQDRIFIVRANVYRSDMQIAILARPPVRHTSPMSVLCQTAKHIVEVFHRLTAPSILRTKRRCKISSGSDPMTAFKS